MPTVPRYTGQSQPRSVPLPFMSPLDISSGPRGFMDTAYSVGSQFRQAKQTSDLTTAMDGAVNSLNDLETLYSNQQNPDLNKFQDDITSLHDTIIDSMDDAQTKQAFASRFSNIAASTRHNVVRAARQRIEENGRASLDSSLLSMRKAVAMSKTEAQKSALLGEAVSQVNDAYREGFINAEHRINMLQKFAGNIEEDEIRAGMMGDAEQTLDDLSDPTQFTYIDPGRRLTLLDRAQTQVRLNDEREVRAEEKLEKSVAKIKKNLIDDADFDTWQLEFNGKLDSNELERRANNRDISQDAYVQIQRRRRDRPEGSTRDNMFVVGDLAYKIGLGMDVRTDLLAAAKAGDIKDTTYISKMSAMGDKHYSLANKIVFTALQPGPFEQYRPDKNKRMADAITKLDELINKGEEAIPSALGIVNDYLSDLRRNIYNLPRPKYLPEGKASRQDEKAIAQAIVDTYDAWSKGILSDEDYRYEMKKIEDMENINKSVGKAGEAKDSVEDQVSKIMKEAFK